MGTYVALRDDKGQQFFMPVDTSNVIQNNALSATLGGLNDTKGFNEQNQMMKGVNDYTEALSGQQLKQAKVGLDAIRNTEAFSNDLTSFSARYSLSDNRPSFEAIVFGLSGNSQVNSQGATNGMRLLKSMFSNPQTKGIVTALQRKTSTFEDILSEIRTVMVSDLTTDEEIQSVDRRLGLMKGYYNTIMS